MDDRTKDQDQTIAQILDAAFRQVIFPHREIGLTPFQVARRSIAEAQADVDRYVSDRRASIRAGARGTGKRFRLDQ